MRLLSTSLFLLAAAVSTASAATKEYPACSPQQSTQYFSSLSNEITQCQKSSTFDLASGSLPSTTQRADVCKCTPLIKQLPNIRVPRCKLSLEGNPYKFKDAIESIFADCNNVRVLEEPLPASQAGSGDKEEIGNEAVAPVATTTTAPPKNNQTSSASGSGNEDASAGSIEALPTAAPTTAPPKATTKPPTTAPVPAATPKSSATTTSVMTMATLAVTTTLAVLLA